MSLSRYSLTIEDQDIWRVTIDRSKQIAVHIVAKLELLLRNELARLQYHFGSREDDTEIREKGLTARPGEINTVFDLLHIATCLATEFGPLKCFRTIGKLCNDLVEHLPGVQVLRPLTLKAVSDLSKTTMYQKILTRR